MNYFFLRFLPYLYYFVREQYRRDSEAAPPTKKKRYIYRTVITLLIFTLGLTITASVIKIRDLNALVAELRKRNEEIKTQSEPGVDMVSRRRYENDLHEVVIEKYGWEYDSRMVVTELSNVCQEKPTACDQRTLHIIENFYHKHPKP